MEEQNSVTCPVCGKYKFEAFGDFDICEICGWENDSVQYEDHTYEGGANSMSLNQAKEAYKKNSPVD